MTAPRPPAAQDMGKTFGAVFGGSSHDSIFDLPVSHIADVFRSAGAIVFRGFSLSNDEFVDFSNRFLHARAHPMRRPNVRHDAFKGALVYDVDDNRSRSPRYLHAELSYTPMMPSMCWFYCEQAAREGGETTLGDGVDVLARLSPATARLFRTKLISYVWRLAERDWIAMFGISDRAAVSASLARFDGLHVRFAEDSALELTYTTSAIRTTRFSGADGFINALADYQREKEADQEGATLGWVRFDDGSAIPDEVFGEIVEACKAAETVVSWGAGDLVMIDNTRIMHGRRTWPETSRRVVYARFGDARFGSGSD